MNAYEATARQQKAEKLAAMLITHGVGYADACLMEVEHWRVVAEAAGVNPPSTMTIATVLKLVFEADYQSAMKEAPEFDLGFDPRYGHPDGWVFPAAESGLTASDKVHMPEPWNRHEACAAADRAIAEELTAAQPRKPVGCKTDFNPNHRADERVAVSTADPSADCEAA